MTAHRLRDSVMWRAADGDVLALDFPSGRYLNTNTSGAMLWPLLTRGATTEELAGLLVREHGLDASQARTDVEAWLDSLRELGVLEEEQASP